jgi:hypothetical protein
MDGDQTIMRGVQGGTKWNPRMVVRVRVGAGIWLLVLTAIFYASGHGGWWEWPLVAVALLHFVLAYRRFGTVRKDPEPHLSKR